MARCDLHFLLTAVLISMVSAAPASAAIRYTQPNGFSSGNCSSAAKCDFEWAVEGAQNGDEIVVGSEIYNVANQVVGPPFAELNIHGESPGTALPRINFSSAGQLTAGGPNSSIRDLHFESGQAGFVVQTAGTIERVYPHTTGAGIACSVTKAVLDSICWSQAAGACLQAWERAGSERHGIWRHLRHPRPDK